MKTYLINITLADGNKVNARVAADNCPAALDRLTHQSDFVEFVGDNEIKCIDFALTTASPINPKNFKIEKIRNHTWRCYDLKRGIYVSWLQGSYNDSVTTHYTSNSAAKYNELSPLEAGTALREIGEYLFKFHKNLL